MAIYLVQHGKCLSKAQDPQKGLSAQGIEDVRRIAQVAAGYGIGVSEIRHSGKQRALQTAQIMGEILAPKKGVRYDQGLNPMDDVKIYSQTLDISSDCMIVGHLPFLEKLAAYLVTDQQERPIFQLQNGGILCLGHYQDSGQAVILWAIMPIIG
jgi:phosphohistidine phosphatase